MPPPTKRLVVKLFLASPNDVVRERKVAEDVIAAINRDFAEHTNCTVELLAWEHVQPGAGRPQERINLCVDQCDLFVGILWKRWGSPAGDGQTGFEEEFERASKIQHSVGSPDLWIFFKDVDADSSEDPGQQLRQVLAFRRRLESEQQVLYKNFADESDFYAKFNTHLLRHLLALQLEKPHGARENHALSPVFPPGEDSAAHTADSTSIVRSMLNAIPSQLGAQPAKFVRGDSLGAVRLVVFASALHYSAVRPRLLSNHAVNTAYAFRERITLTEFEKIHLFTSMIREGNRYTPGWFWVRDGGSVGILERLYTLATEDLEPDTRKVAVEYLTKQLKIEALGRTADEVALTFLQDNSEDVKRVAIEYAATLGSEALIQKSRLRNSWGWRLGAVLNSPGKHPFALDRRLDAGSGGPAARREVEVGLFRRVADRASEHRWVTDAGRAPRGVAGGALVMSPGVRAGRR